MKIKIIIMIVLVLIMLYKWFEMSMAKSTMLTFIHTSIRMVVFVEYIIFTLIKTGAGIKVTVYIMGGMTILYTIFRVIVCPIIHYNMIDWDYSTTEGEIKLAIWDVLTELIIMAGIIALYVL